MSGLARLTPAGFEVAWEQLGLGALPYPLDLEPHGRTRAERERIVADVLADLERGGLARRGRVDADVEDALRLLAQPDSAFTVLGLVDVEAGELVRALAAERRGFTVLAVRRDDAVTLDVRRGGSPAATAVGVLPHRPPGPGRTVTVRASALATGGPAHRDDEVRAARAVLAGPIVGTGHVAALGGRSVTWIDTPHGRYAADGTDWITVAPADRAGMVARITRN
ncbi:ESX secretion-associated protein EspG [Saccharothrix violaceirubra]|uniref:ESAT-6 protein secretion system EspG family protein n=1 Tax=Saccharothrix violaceirubra TaxID=413306 RepID=A0A7W7T120_9PSEU|nr:ESX secretion-associated protein EspG [Saccharothrix violaceirubra]MBB4964612.1 hypothetical protein [Saccharothrix violaceirubra]